jgi:hypothetical protein
MSIGTVSEVNLVCKQKLPLDEATNNQNEREDSKSKYLTMTDRWRKKNTTTNSKKKRAESSEGTPGGSLRSDGTLTTKKKKHYCQLTYCPRIPAARRASRSTSSTPWYSATWRRSCRRASSPADFCYLPARDWSVVRSLD